MEPNTKNGCPTLIFGTPLLWDFIFSSNTHIEYRLYEYPQIRYFKMLQHGQVNELVTWTHVHVTSSIVHVITPKIYLK